MRFRIVRFIAVIQSILFLAHWVVYETWLNFMAPLGASEVAALRIAMAVLSVSFVGASVLAWRSYRFPVRLIYTVSAIWLGALSFFFWASCACWLAYGAAALAGWRADRSAIAGALFAAAVLASVAATINASWIRVRPIAVSLPGLPEAWKGRHAALVSDLHLGHIRNLRFSRRVVARLARLRPDAIFVTGDLYDGTAADTERLAHPWSALSAPWGVYFVTGNHEEFRDSAKYIGAIRCAGIRVLAGEKATIEGVQIIGVSYRDTVHSARLQSVLRQTALDRDRPSILLAHAPNCLRVAEQAGISLQLSGHTHGGQFLPYTWIASRVYRQYVHGLRRYGNLTVFTTWGAGTWGPPMRLGTRPEIVLIRFD